MWISSVGKINKFPGGYTYLFLLAAVAVLAISAEVLVTVNSSVGQSSREEELLFRGLAYRRAIQSYFRAGRENRYYPVQLEYLLADPRDPKLRHLRRLYPDPMSEDGQWRIIRAEDGGIMGVFSQGKDRPRKQALFPPGLEAFEGAQTYADWKFVYEPLK